MTTPPTRTVGKLKQAISRWLPQRRDDSGLTTLEWLLIVAAVAGLAALAVVLVQNVVSDTSEQIAGSSARKTAAQVAASTVEEEAKNPKITQFLAPTPTGTPAETTIQKAARHLAAWAEWDNYFTAKCERIKITYSDADITIDAGFDDPVTTAEFTSVSLVTAKEGAAATTFPQAKCNAS